MLSFFITKKCTLRWLRVQCLSAQQAEVRPWVFLGFLWGFLTLCCECRKKKKAWLIKRRLLATCCDAGRMNLTTGTNPERDLECPWRARSAFHFQITLSQAFLESVLKKKKEDIISIQFVRSLCERTDRLSYFGHAPRGELWGTGGRKGGGWINGHFYSHQIMSGCSNHRRANQKSPRERTLLKSWLTQDDQFTAIALKHNRSYRHEAVQQAWVGFGRGLQPLHRPLLNDGWHLRVFCVEDAETCHVDAAVAVGLHIEGKEVLHSQRSNSRGIGKKRWLICASKGVNNHQSIQYKGWVTLIAI